VRVALGVVRCLTSCASEGIDLAVGLLPDLGTSGRLVNTTVCRVVKLIRPHGVQRLIGEALGLVVEVSRVAERHGGNWPNLGPKHAQQLDLLLALSIRHVYHATVPEGIANMN